MLQIFQFPVTALCSPGSCSLELGRVDGGDGGAPAGLVGDPVQGILRRVPTVASQAEKDNSLVK